MDGLMDSSFFLMGDIQHWSDIQKGHLNACVAGKSITYISLCCYENVSVTHR